MSSSVDASAAPLGVPGGVVELFDRIARGQPERTFLTFGGATLTFAELKRDADALAAYLAERGIERGQRVAVMMNNSPAQVKVIFGLAKAGIVWVPVNARQQGAGLRYLLTHSEPSAIICDAELESTIREAGAATLPRLVLTLGSSREANDSLDDAFAAGGQYRARLPEPEELFAIMYTSGTTGPPKGALVTHAMIRHAGEAAGRVTGADDGDVLFTWEPLYHVGGAQVLVLPLIRNVSLAMVKRFSVSRFWRQVRESEASHVHYLGGVLQMLYKQPETATDRNHPVRVFWGGGCLEDLWAVFQERFGVEIRECYGMTEASSITTYNDANVVGSVGTTVPWFTIDILSEEGEKLLAGERGEVVVRARDESALFKGYFKNEAASARALRGGALHTGDLGSLDAGGNLWFHGRMSDSVRVKGENVSAWEVEHVAAEHPAVEACAMVGVDSSIGDQDIKLFVKLKPGTHLDENDYRGWLAERLAAYQVPTYLATVADFARTPSERIMKHLLPAAPEDGWEVSESGDGLAANVNATRPE